MKNMDWMDFINCKDLDPELFFPASPGVTGRAEAQRAALVCRACPVQLECADHRKDTGATAGVWGGRSTPRPAAAASSGGPHRKDVKLKRSAS